MYRNVQNCERERDMGKGRQAIQLPVYASQLCVESVPYFPCWQRGRCRRSSVAVTAYALGISTGLLLAFSTLGLQNDPLLVGGLVEMALGTSGLGAWRLNLIGA